MERLRNVGFALPLIAAAVVVELVGWQLGGTQQYCGDEIDAQGAAVPWLALGAFVLAVFASVAALREAGRSGDPDDRAFRTFLVCVGIALPFTVGAASLMLWFNQICLS